MAKIIALSNTHEFVYSKNQIIFYTQYPSLKYYLINYKKDQFLNKINYDKCIELYGYNDQNMDVFSDFGENVRLFVTGLKEKYDHYIHCIKWNKYIIIYSEYGSVGIFLDDALIDDMIPNSSIYQFGDCSCKFLELENGDSMIINDGDVSSCILFTVNSPNVSIYETSKNTETMNLSKEYIDKLNFIPTTDNKL